MKKLLFWLGAGVLVALGLAFYKLSRFDADGVPYEVQRKDGRFEIRRYPGLAIARTAMQQGEQDSSFRRLFRFISGDNARNEKIPMTAPVLFDRAPGDKGTMSFLMPERLKRRGVPQPRSEEIELAQRPPAEMAVVRFTGAMRASAETQALAELQGWMKEQHLTPAGDPLIAYYDSPFIPAPLRRNEAMWRIAERR